MEHGIPFYSVPFVPFSALDPDRGAYVCYTCSIEVVLTGLDSVCRTTAEVSHLEIGSLAGQAESEVHPPSPRIRTGKPYSDNSLKQISNPPNPQ